jgi:hypothetical protein
MVLSLSKDFDPGLGSLRSGLALSGCFFTNLSESSKTQLAPRSEKSLE